MTSPFVFVIFGATGDLMDRKLMPALYRLYQAAQVSKDTSWSVSGAVRWTSVEFWDSMRKSVIASVGDAYQEQVFDRLSCGLLYIQGPNLYDRIVAELSRFDEVMKVCVPRFFLPGDAAGAL